MTKVHTVQRAFVGGEISPEMFGRDDDAKYLSGLATCLNFIVRPQGPVQNRAGLRFVDEVADSAVRTRLIRFQHSANQGVVVQLCAGVFRFHFERATLVDGEGNPYEVPHPYQEADFFGIDYAQSADVLTLVHPNYPPMELRRYGALDWRLTEIDFAAGVAAPASVTLATSGGSGGTQYTYRYVVTAVDEDGFSESEASQPVTIASNLFETGRIVTISWEAVEGASRYNVYKYQGGIYGYIGQSATTSLIDSNIAPDMSKSPPLYETTFAADGDYPGCVSYFEQRRAFAGTLNAPQTIWMTNSGTESGMSYSLPTRDDDRIKFRVAALEANAILHIVPLAQLLLMTASGEWQVRSINSDALTPTTVSVRQQSYVGASQVKPVIVNSTILHVASRGGHVREIGYNYQRNGYESGDLSLRATHLFDGRDIVDMALAKAPHQIVWCVSSDGRLLGITYIPEQEVGAWHTHDTDGAIESCAVIAEGDEDALYVVVRREIGGQTRRYVERMESRAFADPADAFFVDSGLSYEDDEPRREFAGLDHLEGKTVSILADGAVHPQQVVTNGAITLDHPASRVHAGLPFVSALKTLPVVVPRADSAGHGRPKNVNRVWLRVVSSGGIFAGPDDANLVEYKQRTDEPPGQPPRLKTDELELTLFPRWGNSGEVAVQQLDPLPVTVVSLTLEVSVGGG